MINLDNQTVSISCPKCGTKNQVTIGEIKKEESIKCLGCGVGIELKDKNGSIREGVKRLQDSFDELQKNMDEIGH